MLDCDWTVGSNQLSASKSHRFSRNKAAGFHTFYRGWVGRLGGKAQEIKDKRILLVCVNSLSLISLVD